MREEGPPKYNAKYYHVWRRDGCDPAVQRNAEQYPKREGKESVNRKTLTEQRSRAACVTAVHVDRKLHRESVRPSILVALMPTRLISA